jgi:cell division protein FtsW (lipid II flippase)
VSRSSFHRLLVVVVALFLVGALTLYVLSIALAHEGGDVARHFDQVAIVAFLGAVLVGIVDFFVRPAGHATADVTRDGGAERRR